MPTYHGWSVDPVLIAFRQQMLYAPKLLLPSQHLNQLQECLVTSHLPRPNILGMCKGLNNNHVLACSTLRDAHVLSKPPKKEPVLAEVTIFYLLLYTYDVYKQLYISMYWHVYMYTYSISSIHPSFQNARSITHSWPHLSRSPKHLVQQLHHIWCPTFHPPVLCSRWVSHTCRTPRWPPNWRVRPARKFQLRSADLLLSARVVAWRT